MSKDDELEFPSFLSSLSSKERSSYETQINEFVIHNVHRPTAIVTSGGTAVDLELHSVRCLENFSTGLRGAVAVEEFVRRGYAVVHLSRTGAASPYARVLHQHVLGQSPHHPLNVRTVGSLLRVAGDKDNDQDDLVRAVLEQDRNPPTKKHVADPYLTDPASARGRRRREGDDHDDDVDDDDVKLSFSAQRSSRLHRALKERSEALRENRILTLPFRTVQSYLAMLELVSTLVKDCRSLVVFYMAAAVSDFYVPIEEMSVHKIQSRDVSTGGGDKSGLTLHLRPVPKALGRLRYQWAPDAFLVSFKLETDLSILRTKAELAMDRYGSHLVVSNLLQSRHEKVWILTSGASGMIDDDDDDDDAEGGTAEPPSEEGSSGVTRRTLTKRRFVEISRPRGHRSDSYDHDDDALESSIIDFVVQAHFEHLSNHYYATSDKDENDGGIRAALAAQRALHERKRKLERDQFWRKLQDGALQVAGSLVALVLSYAINVTLQRRLRRP